VKASFNLMNIPWKPWLLGAILVLLAVLGFGLFARAYLATRRERVLTAICIPVGGSETRLHFAAPTGRYVGWFSRTPELHKSIWEPHSKPPEVNSVSITMAQSAPTTLEISDYGSFTITIPKQSEFLSSELVVATTERLERRLYLNIRPSF